eukprot:256937-Amphidinium_carterae.1
MNQSSFRNSENRGHKRKLRVLRKEELSKPLCSPGTCGGVKIYEVCKSLSQVALSQPGQQPQQPQQQMMQGQQQPQQAESIHVTKGTAAKEAASANGRTQDKGNKEAKEGQLLPWASLY